LGKDPPADRQEVVKNYKAALRLEGDARRGATVFAKNCLGCHALQGQGHLVGPDLSGVGSRLPAALLEDILDPDKVVAPDYLSYVLVTTGGQVLSGLIANETATAVKLRRGEGAEDVVLRTEIQDLRASGQSLMPAGLEQSVGLQDMADLLAFLRRPVPLAGGAGQP
jgi:putative heme-binding domain-containing protein